MDIFRQVKTETSTTDVSIKLWSDPTNMENDHFTETNFRNDGFWTNYPRNRDQFRRLRGLKYEITKIKQVKGRIRFLDRDGMLL